MLTIRRPLPSRKSPFQILAGQSPVVTVPVQNIDKTRDVAFTLTGSLVASAVQYAMRLGPAGGQEGTIPPLSTGSVVLVGSPMPDQSQVAAQTLDLSLTLTDRTNGVEILYGLSDAYAVPKPAFPPVPAYCPTDWWDGPYTEEQAVHTAIYLTAHQVNCPAGCPMFVWQMQEGDGAPFYALTIGSANPGNFFEGATACYVNGQSVPFSPRGVSVRPQPAEGGPIYG